ncbi:MAG: hypothetical protein HRF43_07485 [Phycisphaerae bacterium]|jgi:hypothetical protein
MANNEKFGFTIEAADATKKAFTSVLAGATSFGRRIASAFVSPLRGLSKIQLPLFAGIQNLKSLSAGVKALGDWSRDALRGQVVTTEFANRLGIAETRAYAAARALQEAAAGAMNLDQTMEATNRLLARGLSVQQIGKIFQFATARSKTANEDFGGIVESISSALVTGRTMALKQMGLLAGDVANKGAGRFEVMRQTMAGIDEQLAKMGVTGRENVFTWDRMASAVDDVADAIRDTIGSGKLFGDITRRVLETAGGFRDLLNQNAGAIQEVFDSVLGSLGQGFVALLTPVRELFSVMKSVVGGQKGMAEMFARIGFLASKAMVGIRIGLVEIKRAALETAAAILNNMGAAMVDVVSLFKPEAAEAFSKAIVAGHRALSVGIREAYRESRRLEGVMAGINEEQERAVAKIRAMKNETLKVGPVFEGLGNRMRNWAAGFLAPIREMGPALLKGLGDFAAKARDAAGMGADAIRDRYAAAVDKVQALRDELAKLAGERRDDLAQFEQQAFERQLAQVRATRGEGAGRMLEFQRAQQLIERSRLRDQTPEARRESAGQALEMLNRLAQTPEVAASRRASEQIQRAIDQAEFARLRAGVDQAAPVRDQLEQVMRERGEASRAEQGRKLAEAWKPLADMSGQLARLFGELGRNVSGVSGLLKGARRFSALDPTTGGNAAGSEAQIAGLMALF